MSALGDAALVFLTSAGLCLAVGGWAIQRLARLEAIQPARYEDCPPLLAYQQAKRGTPTMGGLFVLPVAALAAAAAGGLRQPSGWWVLGMMAGLGALGAWDDLLKFKRPNAQGLRARTKLAVALALGGLLGFSLAAQAGLGWGAVPFSMVVVAGSAHAVNLTDGMDGLAAGCLAAAFCALGLVAMGQGPRAHALVPWCAALAGACVGFLWFNGFPASVFLGDVGALGLGAALGAVSLLTGSALWLMVIGGVFVAEAVSVMLQVASYKWRNQRRIFRVAPLHHHFHLGGLTEPKVIVRFWIVGVLLALAGLGAMERP
ncbi:MAG: phospho-N-acetylmuramoyl-pentapeptide-transferase [Candidatus Omnitrophica bacterium]|nr:phospho-N-acetylmuramoyl-pentapeptide-transferase [Candidatus Omnitrophota bacterium]